MFRCPYCLTFRCLYCLTDLASDRRMCNFEKSCGRFTRRYWTVKGSDFDKGISLLWVRRAMKGFLVRWGTTDTTTSVAACWNDLRFLLQTLRVITSLAGPLDLSTVQPKLTRVMTLVRIFWGARRETVSELNACSLSLKKKLRISLPSCWRFARRDNQRSICGRATLTM